MAPGAFSILAPFLGRKSKKYEKLETDDPEKRRQEATQEEIKRLNSKIDRLVHSMSRDDIEKADSPAEECVVCCQARAVMQVAPCGHQCQCRLCFVQNIQDAVTNRNLPLRCLICNAKILRVKNNSKHGGGQDHPVHNLGKLPKSVSGYSLQQNGMPHSSSNHSMSSGVSSMSTSSYGSGRSVKSNSSVRSNASVKSSQSNSSWFSIGSLSNFQAGKLIDSNTFSKPPRRFSSQLCLHDPGISILSNKEALQNIDLTAGQTDKGSSLRGHSRHHSWHATLTNGTASSFQCEAREAFGSAHSLSSAGKARPKPKPLPASNSSSSLKSWTSSSIGSKATTPTSPKDKENDSESAINIPSPRSIDSRIRAIQGYTRVATNADDEDEPDDPASNQVNNQKSRLQVTRDNFRRSQSEHSSLAGHIQNPHPKPILRRLSLTDKHGSKRFSKSPDLAETTFTMSTIEEENEISLSLRNLASGSKDEEEA
eukprot:maker-scaffold320_size207635-snap-gene-0.11 protein:Tk09310 transcript:maker-scaffold320_size207635-snap-gene-0.11-mRNA-1 annotation:"PREDICTED: hypothetical protein LOC100642385 isoform 1"